jgi:hypothetical protein
MAIYYFAVDYEAKEKMRAPGKYSDKCIWFPGHPLPNMVAFKNYRGSHFQFINDVYAEEEYEFKDITDQVYEEWKSEFPEFFFDPSYEKEKQ